MKTNCLKAFFSHPLVAVLALVVAPVGIYNWGQHAQYTRDAALEKPQWADPVVVANSQDQPRYSTQYVNVAGLQPREFQSAAESGAFATEEVIGVVINGQPRAYLLEATRSLKECVINDVVGGQPIAVVHAVDSGVVRVLTPRGFRKIAKGAAAAASPPELSIVGAIEGQLYLSGYGQEFFFDAEDIPLVDYPFSRCTWRVWRRAYPDSDLYTGSFAVAVE